jgi:hypothetical protein
MVDDIRTCLHLQPLIRAALGIGTASLSIDIYPVQTQNGQMHMETLSLLNVMIGKVVLSSWRAKSTLLHLFQHLVLSEGKNR